MIVVRNLLNQNIIQGELQTEAQKHQFQDHQKILLKEALEKDVLLIKI